MKMFAFNVGSRSVERCVADAIGQGIAQRIRSNQDAGVPPRFAELIARLDDSTRGQSHNLSRLQSRRPRED